MSKPKALALFLRRTSHNDLPDNGKAALEDLLAHQAGLDLTIDDDQVELTPERLAVYGLIVNYSGYKNDLEPTDKQLRALLAVVEGGTPYIALHGAILPFKNQLYYRQPLGHLLENPDANDLLNPVQVRYLEMLQNAFLTWPDKPVPNSLLNETQLRFLELAGSAFITHGTVEPFTVNIIDHDHPITRGVADFEIIDELYELGGDRSRLHVLAESAGQPLLHVSRWGAGKVHYNALGHNRLGITNPSYQRLVLQAVAWALDAS